MSELQARGDDGFRVDIGRADRGRTFVRVVHISSGKERIIVGIGQDDPHDVAKRLTEELRREFGHSNCSCGIGKGVRTLFKGS